MMSVSGGREDRLPKHNAHRLCPVDAESVNMDREETHRLGLGRREGRAGTLACCFGKLAEGAARDGAVGKTIAALYC